VRERGGRERVRRKWKRETMSDREREKGRE
jgi:hypothetical protein